MEAKKIHIGQWIKDVLNEKKISQSELSRRINTTKQNMGKILEKDSLDVKQLFTISQVLDYNFFEPFTKSEPKQNQKSRVILQIEIDENKIEEVLKQIDNKKLYNILRT